MAADPDSAQKHCEVMRSRGRGLAEYLAVSYRARTSCIRNRDRGSIAAVSKPARLRSGWLGPDEESRRGSRERRLQD